jgi:hypothetical protein
MITAIARAAAPAGLAVPLLLAVACTPASAQPAAFGGPKLLIHGNYCGPGNNAPLPPVDALDAACARHDACTPDRGLPSRGCNLRLQQEAEMISRDPRQPDDLRALAGLIAAGTAVIPSSPQPTPAAVPYAAPRPYGFEAPADADDDLD